MGTVREEGHGTTALAVLAGVVRCPGLLRFLLLLATNVSLLGGSSKVRIVQL